MNRSINKVGVLGSGVMGSQIACHMANIGLEVVLLDIVPKEAEESKDKKERNQIVNGALQKALKSNPSPVYSKSVVQHITTGNFTDDLNKLEDCDWIIEAVIERLDIKQGLFEKVENYRKAGSIISTNTSGIPINLMLDGRSDDFKKHFLGTHFFNPPRYLELLEIIPSQETDPEVVDFMMHYGRKFIGKKTVLCKDTPAFIANRIGIFSIMTLFHQFSSLGLSIEDVDKLTGPVLGRPKSATFRTADVVGLDTLLLVADGLKNNLKKDEAVEVFDAPDFIKKMAENDMLGSKSGKGFYKKVKNKKGESEILTLDPETLEYRERKKSSFQTLEQTKSISNLNERMPVLFAGKDQAGEFYRASFTALFQYATCRIPEIADELYRIDDALKAGFGWKQGPFEAWDAIGFERALTEMEKTNQKPADWVYAMKDSGITSFYKVENGVRYFYDIEAGEYREIPGQKEVLLLDVLRDENTVWSNAESTIVDLGDGILNLEFHSKMNTIGQEIIQGINTAIEMAEKEYKGLVISNTGDNFSAGANVGMIFMFAVEQELDELEFAVRTFQKTMMRVRYSNIPVVVAPHQMALGGGCELAMHADKVVAHAETYIGLVEFGVGLIPGGGGTKEFALRLSDSLKEGDVRINAFRDKFLTVGQAKVAKSAQEGFELGYLREGIDEIVVSREHQLSYAKLCALNMHEKGYTKPRMRKDITVLGNEALGAVYVGANSMLSGNYISEHDQLISQKLGYVLSGGDLSEPTQVDEEYLLALERKAFLELCMQKKTLERIQSLLKTGKILRN